jgi:hypothetical protein
MLASPAEILTAASREEQSVVMARWPVRIDRG